MLKIKLQRVGRKGQPNYRIAVTERRSKRDGKYVAALGYYRSYTNPVILKLDTKEYDEWLTKGAQPTDTVKYLRTKATSDEEITIDKTKKNKNFKAKNEASSQ